MLEAFKQPDIVERANRVHVLGELQRHLSQDPEALFKRLQSRPEEVSIADDMYRFVLSSRQDYEQVMAAINTELEQMMSGKGKITRYNNLLSGERSEQ